MGNSLLENIFSIKNSEDRRHKLVTFCGVRIKLKKTNFKEKIESLKIMYDKSLDITIPDDLTLQMCFNNDCNCHCKFCGEEISHCKEERLVFSDKWLYEDFLPLYPKTKNLVPTWGEITHGTEGYKFLSYIAQNYPKINIFAETNGIAFNEKWAELASENLMRLNFSINAINEEYFKKTVWEKDGMHTLVMKNFDYYLNLLKQKNIFCFKPSVSFVLNVSNFDTLSTFIEMVINRGIQSIMLFFDIVEAQQQKCNPEWVAKVEEIFIILMEMERVFNNKVFLGYKLFVPINNLPELEDKVAKEDINYLKEKYARLNDIVRDFKTWDELYVERDILRKKYDKSESSYYEDLTGVTFHQEIYKDSIICVNPWKHLRVKPDGRTSVCSWAAYLESQNLNHYVKNNLIDWNAYFNNPLRKKLRYNFEKKNYLYCMQNCPGTDDVSVNDFNKKYTLKKRSLIK